ncbi:DNA mismatch repair protein Msh2 [Trichonephila clavipes]|nr:DNA mismatch repair protein Msh2 [Trichonephila clavipes]
MSTSYLFEYELTHPTTSRNRLQMMTFNKVCFHKIFCSAYHLHKTSSEESCRMQGIPCSAPVSSARRLLAVKQDLGITTVKLEMFEKIGFAFRLTLKEERFVRNRKDYITIDTRSSGVRFQTVTLKEKNEKYCNLRKDYEEMQKEIVDNMVEVSASYIQPLRILNTKIAWLDVALSLTRVACKSSIGYVRPKLKEKGECHIVLKDCRHPYLEDTVRSYIPNDVEITKDKHRFYFVTGPNMGGKSTYIRSVALSVLLAQIGCYVPCSAAEISVVDAFFTRIGAFDNPSKAMSTFMYEMLEIKNMISNATSDSLLIIDEMGRGTSTYDGFGLSWAISKCVAEKIKAPCLFATHFHDLTTLSDVIPSIGNLHVDAICSKEKVTFLYHVKPGVCSESFGIHVAKLAAFPHEVIELAEKKLEELEKSCISFDQISSEFAGLPNGDDLIQIVQQLFPSSACRPKKRNNESDGEPMDVEGNDGKSSNIPEEPSFFGDNDPSKRLLTILEEIEKKLECSQ